MQLIRKCECVCKLTVRGASTQHLIIERPLEDNSLEAKNIIMYVTVNSVLMKAFISFDVPLNNLI
jgi:hypothetical protein